MKKILLVVALLVMVGQGTYGQETYGHAISELQSAKWKKYADDGSASLSLNTATILRLNGIVIFRTRLIKRGVHVYQVHLGHCTQSLMSSVKTGWAMYPPNKSIVRVEIPDAEDFVVVQRDTVADIILTYACEHATETKVIK